MMNVWMNIILLFSGTFYIVALVLVRIGFLENLKMVLSRNHTLLLCNYTQVLVNLEEGLGLSLVNKVPEELVFTTLSGIDVHFTRTAANEVLELSIHNIQVSVLHI